MARVEPGLRCADSLDVRMELSKKSLTPSRAPDRVDALEIRGPVKDERRDEERLGFL